jgi:hypothetical protein
VAIINTLHAQAGLPPFASTDESAIQAQIVSERMAALFLDSHRLGDLIRHHLPLVPVAGTPYPNGGKYGSQLCFPLPEIEIDNNPNIPHG